MDDNLETQDELPGVVPVGERLREARQAKKLEIEDIASKTRIPKRHLENLEKGDWAKLPAPTYTMGFAKAYAAEVGLDRDEIAQQLREEMGDMPLAPSEDGYEVADPARSFPRWLIWVALLALVGAIAWFIWSNEQRLGDNDEAQELALDAEEEGQAELQTPDSVLLIANAPVDVRITDGDTVLFEESLASGQSYVVPADATAPMLAVSDAGALRIAVGTADAPAIGDAGSSANNISLLGRDLLAGPQDAAAIEPAAAPAPAPRTAAPVRSNPTPPPARRTPPPAPAPAQRDPAPATNSGGTGAAGATRPANSPTSNENDTPSVQFDNSAPPPPPLNPPAQPDADAGDGE